MTCRIALRRPSSMRTEDSHFVMQLPDEVINVSKRASPMYRVVMVVATVGVFAFVAATVGGVFRPAVYSLASAP
jgi:hypothetical protein